MTFDEKIVEIRTGLDAAQSLHEAEVSSLTGEKDALVTELATARARIAELEAEEPPPPPPPPGVKPPAIMDERFPNGVDWTRLYSNGETSSSSTNIESPRERFTKTPDGINVLWIKGSPKNCRRAELGVRATIGGGETPRRDAPGTERWYLIELTIPADYLIENGMADQKRVLWQCHGGGDNPPLSLELRNGTFRLNRSIDGNRMELLNPGASKPGIPCVKGVKHRLVVHSLWKPDSSGWTEAWFDTLHKPKLPGKTCYAGEGLMNCFGSYQPGYALFPDGYRVSHLIHRVAVGNETNKLEDFA